MNENLVMVLELPIEVAPVLNAYANMPSFRRAKLRKQVDGLILAAKQSWNDWDMGVRRKTTGRIVKGRIKVNTEVTGGRRRKVVITRHSSKEPDEISCDVLGGKIPIDRLIQARVLRDDNRKWLEREGHWTKASPKNGKVVVEIYEL